MATVLTKYYKIINSQGDMTGIGPFATEAEAQIWITANAQLGHEYFVIPYFKLV